MNRTEIVCERLSISTGNATAQRAAGSDFAAINLAHFLRWWTLRSSLGPLFVVPLNDSDNY